MKLQKINTDNIRRIETGPVQFNNDWPCVVIRGDNALYTAMMLQQVAQLLEKYMENDGSAGVFTTSMGLTELKNHVKLLSSCNAQFHREQP